MADYLLVTVGKGPAWDHARARREQAGWDEHAAFMDGLVEDGFVVLGGPVGDSDHGDEVLLVVAAPTADAVRARLENDPWHPEMLTVATIEPWTVWLRSAAH